MSCPSELPTATLYIRFSRDHRFQRLGRCYLKTFCPRLAQYRQKTYGWTTSVAHRWSATYSCSCCSPKLGWILLQPGLLLCELRVVHNFTPINSWTIESQYPISRIEEVMDTLITPRYSTYISTDAINGYWTVVKDVKAWCQSCKAYQLKGLRKKKMALNHIQHFQPMLMLGLDFIGPITLP